MYMKRTLLVIMLIVSLLFTAILLISCSQSSSEPVAPSAAPADGAEVPSTAEEASISNAVSDDALHFTTTTLTGEEVTESLLTGNQVTMINFWEPWCGPCVNEMPDLQKLYETYKDQGFLILGVFSTEDGTQDIVESLGIQYPILHFSNDFLPYVGNYVPCTIFVDAQGKLLTESSIVGSKSYEQWESILLSYLP